MSYLVTGAAGFIGFHTCINLLKKGEIVVGIDSLNNYYSVDLKKKRLSILKKYKTFFFYKRDLSKRNFFLGSILKKKKIKFVIHLAAQAGVRYSIDNPTAYIESNILGFFNTLKACQEKKIKHFVYASTSSVYGESSNFPLDESQPCNEPAQLYAATKKSNEIIAHAYSKIHKIPTTGLRFFTVYGPWGRPDMALYKFAKNILNGKEIDVYNYGRHVRDFSYIDDVVFYILSIIKKIPQNKNQTPFRILNVGNNKPEKLMNYIKLIELNLKKKAIIKKYPLQKGDVYKTHASMKKIWSILKKKKQTTIKVGVKKFIEWFKNFNV